MKKIYCVICGKYRKFKKPFFTKSYFKKYHTFSKKYYFFLLFVVSVRMKMQNI